MYKKCLVEFHGSAMMAFIVIVSGGNGLAITAGLWMCVIAAGGAFFNPCITLACLFREINKEKVPTEKLIEAVLCMMCQIIGVFLGALLGWVIEGETLAIMTNPEKDDVQVFFMEVLFTFQLILTLMVILDLKQDPLHVGIFSVIITVWVCLHMSGPISGGCLNPTLCIGINVVHYINTQDSFVLEHLWIYAFAPLIGSMLAVSAAGALTVHKHHPIIEHAEHHELKGDDHH